MVCFGNSSSVIANSKFEPSTSLDFKINAAVQMALLLDKTNLDGFVAFCDRHFDLDRLSLLAFEKEFCRIAYDFDIKALFRPSDKEEGLVALAINSFKASELADTFNQGASEAISMNAKALQVEHNLEGVYKF